MDHVLSLTGAAQSATLASTLTEVIAYVCLQPDDCLPSVMPASGCGESSDSSMGCRGSLQVFDESVLTSHTKLGTEQFREFLNPST